jgi:hypothetical protein
MRINITGLSDDRFIAAIKTLRDLTGKGLKESKEIMEDVRVGKAHKVEALNPNDALRILAESNLVYSIEEVVEGAREGIECLENAAIQFIKAGRIDIAIESLKLIAKARK